MSQNDPQNLPGHITRHVSQNCIDVIANIINNMPLEMNDKVITVNNRNLFDIIGDIICNIQVQYPKSCMVLLRDKLERITYKSGEYFVSEIDPIHYEKNSILSHTIIIDVGQKVDNKEGDETDSEILNPKPNILIFRNCSDHSELITLNKTVLKATLLVSDRSCVLKPDSLIIKFSGTSKVRIIAKELIKKHPGSLFDLKYSFNNCYSNVLQLMDVDYACFDNVLAAMDGDLESFDKNCELMDFLGLKLNPLSTIFSSIMKKEIEEKTSKHDKKINKIMKRNYKLAVKVNSFIVTNKNECVFVHNLQQYYDLKLFLQNDEDIVPIQLSHAKFNIKSKNDSELFDGNVIDFRYVAIISVMDGAPIYINFCDEISCSSYYANSIQLINNYEDLRRKVLRDACHKHKYAVLEKIDDVNLGGGAKEYIGIMSELCNCLVQELCYGESDWNMYRGNRTTSPLNTTLLERCYKKMNMLKINKNPSYFDKYIDKLTYEDEIDDDYKDPRNYKINVKSYFGFLRLDPTTD